MASTSTPLRQPAPLPEDDDEALRELIDEGLAELDRGEGVDGETFMRELRAETERLLPRA